MREIKDKYFKKIINKFYSGEYTMGLESEFTRYHIERDISSYSMSERTPEVCAALMHYSRCHFSDVPASSRTREFFIDVFSDEDVNNYIKEHINQFDRQFFKDLIVTNKYSTHFETNCFSVMPLEYIDDEMISLAIIHSLDWGAHGWFDTLVKRKKSAITEDVWKLAARLYGRECFGANVVLDNVPDEYKDFEFYKELCLCNYNAGMELEDNKPGVMDSIPDEVITPEFVISLINDDIKNVARFNDKALDMVVPCNDGTNVIVWQYALLADGYLIRYMELNDERIEFFLNHYSKQSGEYNYAFKNKYKKYKIEAEENEKIRRNQEMNGRELAEHFIMHSLLFSMEGEDPFKAVGIVSNQFKEDTNCVLPIRYQGVVPSKYAETHDREEYLAMLYQELGIEVIEELDDYFYSVKLPEGYKVEGQGYWYTVKDKNDQDIITYFYDSKFYDKDAYVSNVNLPEDVVRKILK